MSAAFTNSEFGKPPSEMEDLLRGVARKCDEAVPDSEAEAVDLERLVEPVLRESGLLRLLEAGKAMRGTIEMECSDEDPGGCDKQWDAALAELKEKLNG